MLRSKRRTVGKSTGSGSDFLLKIRDDNINAAVELLIKKEKENKGRLPHGAMRQIIADLKVSGIVTDRDRLYYLKFKRMKQLQIKKAKRKQKRSEPPTQLVEFDAKSIAAGKCSKYDYWRFF
jgi:hypothetical protein